MKKTAASALRTRRRAHTAGYARPSLSLGKARFIRAISSSAVPVGAVVVTALRLYVRAVTMQALARIKLEWRQ